MAVMADCIVVDCVVVWGSLSGDSTEVQDSPMPVLPAPDLEKEQMKGQLAELQRRLNEEMQKQAAAPVVPSAPIPMPDAAPSPKLKRRIKRALSA